MVREETMIHIFLITLALSVHQSFEENISRRDVDPKRYNPVTDTIDYQEEDTRKSKSKELLSA